MAVEKIIEFVVLHSKTIGQIVFALILAIGALWIFMGLGKEEENGGYDDEKLRDIEESLKKLLQAASHPDGTLTSTTKNIKDAEADPKAAAAPAPAAATATPAQAATPTPEAAALAAAAAVDADTIKRIKIENEAQQKRIQELESQIKAASENKGPSADPADKKKIEELEKKLAEYAIIEDDIANLNLYKQENIRLKTQLETSQKGAPSAPAPEAAPAAAAQPAIEPAEAAPATPAPEPAPAPAPAATAAPAPTPTVEASKIETPAPAPAATADASPPPAENQDPTPKAIDSEKLLAEFDALVSAGATDPAAAKPANPNADKDSGEALINEFENFMKSSNQ